MSVGRVGGLGLKLDGSSGVVSFPTDVWLQSRVHGQIPAGRDAALPQVSFPCRAPGLMMIAGSTVPLVCQAGG